MMYATPQLAARELALTPEGITADAYQLAMTGQVQRDLTPNGRSLPTIRGIPIKPYIYMGVEEEFGETLEEDGNHPPYNRLHRLLAPDADSYEFATPDATLYHAKEFGDLSWYCTAALGLYGVRLANIASKSDFRIADLDAFARLQARERTSSAAWHESGLVYIGAATAFLASFEDLLRNEGNTTRFEMFALRKQLGASAGRLFVSMSVVLQSKLDATLAEVLSDNNTKIERRIREKKIFGEGGDKR